MKPTTVEPGQLWRYTDYRKRETLFLVVEPRHTNHGGWNLFAVSGGVHSSPGQWEMGVTMITNQYWEFLA